MYNSADNLPNPIEVLFLTRYEGPIDEEAVGLKLAHLDSIKEKFTKLSSYDEVRPEAEDVWTFE